MKVIVHIERRAVIADPEGATIARSLADLGYSEVTAVRTGRTLHLDVSDDGAQRVLARVTEMCEKLLANPVIEDYRVEVEVTET